MAEVEIRTAHGVHTDAFGQTVGVLVGIIGIVLAVATILSHREHTAQVGIGILTALAPDRSQAAAAVSKFSTESQGYAKDAEAIQKIARERDAESSHAESRALRFDLSEGFLELGLVMSSLYFVSHRKFFVALGGSAAVIGTVIGVLGLLT